MVVRQLKSLRTPALRYKYRRNIVMFPVQSPQCELLRHTAPLTSSVTQGGPYDVIIVGLGSEPEARRCSLCVPPACLKLQGIQLIVGLGPVVDTARFSHRPAAVADCSRPAFPL
jgi:hypothetical protein